MKKISLLFFLLASSIVTANPIGPPIVDSAESMLIDVVGAMEQQDYNSALIQSQALVKKFPDFKLAHLILGDLLSARAFDAPLFQQPDAQLQTRRLYDEARARITYANSNRPQEHLPGQILQLADRYSHALLFELSTSRLLLVKNQDGHPEIIGDHYISIGKEGMFKQKEGDNKTPLGVYRITSHLPDKDLPELYGHGAYPINYPNAWDRLNQRTGHGIWLHGVPRDTYSRPPLDSEGCMVVSNDALDRLAAFVDIGHTPVILVKKIDWLDRQQWQNNATELSMQIETWRKDWESLDVEQYLDNYSKSFSNLKHDYDTWAQRKRSVAANKSEIRVNVSSLDIFRYPEEKDLVLVSFIQRYESNNYSGTIRKFQYWKKEADQVWRIIFEA